MTPMPTGTVTLLFTDIEGSTKLWEKDPEAMSSALARHDQLMRERIETRDGHVFKTVGDAFCAAFSTPQMGLMAALDAQLALVKESWPPGVALKVRMALHTGTVEIRDNDYFGQPLNRVARLLSTGSGGQILMSLATQDLVRDTLPSVVALRDLGAVRLKDLIRPERVFQALAPGLPADFPPLKALDARKHNLPVHSTSFLGRQQELAAVQRALGEHRLVSLLGTGGAGKTRLALHVAADRIDQFSDGVWFVDLCAVLDGHLLPDVIAAAVGVRPPAEESLPAALLRELGSREILLILDNCEHLLPACASWVDAVLSLCPRVRVLTTSREPLRVGGEFLFPVPPLAVPAPGVPFAPSAVDQYAAVQLFMERALAVNPRFTVTAENAPAIASICHRLDGIPLAIELAAARVRSLSVQDLNARLDERFRVLTGIVRTALPRQQTLRSLVDWSYDLLSPGEKTLLARLSVFAGGCDLAAAETVCGAAPLPSRDILDLLTSLADKNLLTVAELEGSYRFGMLETIREYAAEKLLVDGAHVEQENRHLDYYLQLVRTVAGSGEGQSWPVFRRENDNLRAALSRSPRRNALAGLQMANMLKGFWFSEGQLNEAILWTKSLLAAPAVQSDRAALWPALHSLAFMSIQRGEPEQARSAAEHSLALCRELHDRLGEAGNLRVLAMIASSEGDHRTGVQLAEQSTELARQSGNQRALGMTLNTLGTLLSDAGSHEAAGKFLEESLQLARERGDSLAIAATLNSLGYLSLKSGRADRAHELCSESLRLRRSMKVRAGLLPCLAGLASAAFHRGDPLRAGRLWAWVMHMMEDPGLPAVPRHAKSDIEAEFGAARAAAGDAAFQAAYDEGLRMSLDEVIGYALGERSQAVA